GRGDFAGSAARFVEDDASLEVAIRLALGQARVTQLVGGDAFRRTGSDELESRARHVQTVAERGGPGQLPVVALERRRFEVRAMMDELERIILAAHVEVAERELAGDL